MTPKFDTTGYNTLVKCEGCGDICKLSDTAPGRLPTGEVSWRFYDKRDKTPTGGRLGDPNDPAYRGRFKQERTTKYEFLGPCCDPARQRTWGPQPDMIARQRVAAEKRAADLRPRLVKRPA